MMDSYNLIQIFVICFSAEKDYDIMLKSKVKEGGQKVNTFIIYIQSNLVNLNFSSGLEFFFF